MKTLNAILALILALPVAYAQPKTAISDIPLAVSQETSATMPILKALQSPVVIAIQPDRTLYAIGTCESHHAQYNSNGTVLRGRVNHSDVGEYQINEYYNGAEAKILGYDIYTQAGNQAMAVWLYEHQGTQPWSASRSCWLTMI